MIEIEQKDTSMDENDGMFIYSHEEVDQDLSYLTTFEDEVTGLQHYLPECDINCFNHCIGFETFNSLEGIDIESLSWAFKYDQIKFDGGIDLIPIWTNALDLYLAQEGEGTKAEGENNGLHGTGKSVLGDFNLQLRCKDLILDAEAANKVSNWSYVSWEKAFLGNLTLESHSPHIQERDCRAETSDSSSRNCSEIVNGLNSLECGKTSKVDAIKTVCLTSTSSSGSSLESVDVSNDQLVPAEKHERREKLVDCNFLKSVSSPLKTIIFDSASASNTSDVLVTQTIIERSATDERQEQNSNYHRKKDGASFKDARDRSLVVRSLKKCKGSGAVQLGFQEQSLEGSCVKVPFSLPVQKGQSTKVTSLVNDFDDYKDSGASESNVDSDMEASADTQDDASEGDYGTRRKKARKGRRHRRWTASEVIKLIEGVSVHGVGKWTHIKKSHFSSSSYRTSVNLKDKWRNLLKASGNEMLNKRKVEKRQTQASQQLPESVWRRVRELAIINSYPRESKTKVPCKA